jgi:hypothetical protein
MFMWTVTHLLMAELSLNLFGVVQHSKFSIWNSAVISHQKLRASDSFFRNFAMEYKLQGLMIKIKTASGILFQVREAKEVATT